MATVQQLADYFAWQCEIGRADWPVEIDPQSIPCGWTCQLETIEPPKPARMANETKRVVFISAALEKD